MYKMSTARQTGFHLWRQWSITEGYYIEVWYISLLLLSPLSFSTSLSSFFGLWWRRLKNPGVFSNSWPKGTQKQLVQFWGGQIRVFRTSLPCMCRRLPSSSKQGSIAQIPSIDLLPKGSCTFLSRSLALQPTGSQLCFDCNQPLFQIVSRIYHSQS